MKSWRTTMLSAVAAAMLLISDHLHDPSKPWVDVSKLPEAAALMGLGAAAKDSAVHSTSAQVAEASTAEKERLLRQ